MHLFSGAPHAQHKVVKNIFLCCCLLVLFFAVPRFAHATPVQLDGELEVLHEDHKDKTSHTFYYLKTDSGARNELRFKAHPPHLPTGTKVRVRGDKSGNLITLNTGDTSTTTSTTTSTSSLVVTEAIVPNTFGEQRTLVLLVNFQDQPTNQPWTVDQVKNFVFSTVSNFYKENSYQNTWLTGDVYGWYTIPVSSTCNTLNIENSAKQAAAAAGVNLSAYTRYVYMFPSTSSCAFSGTATVGGNPSRAWINGYLDLKTVGHELGHNFGLHHSHSLACSGSTLGTSCAQVEYGDGVDIMGWSSSAHLSAFQKEWLGWLNYGVMPPITTVDTSDTYTIAPYETTGSSAKALKIYKSTNPTNGEKTYYYIEYRQAIGFDGVLAASTSMMNGSNILNGVIIRTGVGGWGDSSYLLDMTPETYDLYTRDPALAVGKSYTDPDAGVTITTRWVNSTNAAIDVTFNNTTSSCTHSAPSVLLSSSQGSVAAGTPVTYTVALTNNDSSACAASTFNLQTNVPSGWSGNLASSALTAGPGGTASTSFTVTSPSSALAGTYNVGVTATSSSTTFSASGSASYSIAAATATSFTTSVATDKASYAKGNTVTIIGTATSGSTPVANASVTFTVTKPNGAIVTQTAITGSNGQAVYQLKLNKQKDPAGVYQVKGLASNSGSSATATTSFAVQ